MKTHSLSAGEGGVHVASIGMLPTKQSTACVVQYLPTVHESLQTQSPQYDFPIPDSGLCKMHHSPVQRQRHSPAQNAPDPASRLTTFNAPMLVPHLMTRSHTAQAVTKMICTSDHSYIKQRQWPALGRKRASCLRCPRTPPVWRLLGAGLRAFEALRVGSRRA